MTSVLLTIPPLMADASDRVPGSNRTALRLHHALDPRQSRGCIELLFSGETFEPQARPFVPVGWKSEVIS